MSITSYKHIGFFLKLGWWKEFVTSVIDDKLAKSRRINVPPPVMEKLGNPTHIKFVIRGEKVMVEAGVK